MPRSARVVIVGCPHHVTQRGNNRQDVFFHDDDRKVFLDILGEACTRFGLSLAGFCLMTNHIHLVAVPKEPDSLGEAMRRVSQLYTQYVNRVYKRCGHLWQDRFFSCPLDDIHFWTAMRYVERNPVRAGMVERAWLYPWSSARAHGPEGNPFKLRMDAWPRKSSNYDWWEALARQESKQYEQAVQQLRLCTSRGRPMGSESFIDKLERQLGIILRPKANGRPKNKDKKKGKPKGEGDEN